MVQKVIVLRGLPGSGKSSWAKEQVKKNPGVYKRLNKDDLRAMLDASHHTAFNEQFVLEMRDIMILKALDYGKSVIIDDTNFHSDHEITIRSLVEDWNGQQKLYGKKGNATVEVKFFDLPLEECIERDANRKDSVGKKVIMEMYNKYLKPKQEEISVILAPKHDPNLPDAIICDLDGTLALLNGRDPYDASTCENDLLNEPVYLIVKKLFRHEPFEVFRYINLLMVSGREEKDRDPTTKWLNKNVVPFSKLWMRSTGDFRKDAIIKQEIYEREIKGKYNVLFVLDDRLQVCRMWHSLGLPLFKFGDPDADF